MNWDSEVHAWWEWFEREPSAACDILAEMTSAREEFEEELPEAFWKLYESVRRVCVGEEDLESVREVMGRDGGNSEGMLTEEAEEFLEDEVVAKGRQSVFEASEEEAAETPSSETADVVEGWGEGSEEVIIEKEFLEDEVVAGGRQSVFEASEEEAAETPSSETTDMVEGWGEGSEEESSKSWGEYLSRWKALATEEVPPYGKIWEEYQRAQESLGEAPKEIQAFWEGQYTRCRRERAEVVREARRAYREGRVSVEEKRRALERALDDRLYPSRHLLAGGERYQEAVADEEALYTELERLLQSLEDPLAPVVVEAELNQMERELENLDLIHLPVEAYEWVRDAQARVERWIRASRDDEQLGRLADNFHKLLESIREKRDEVYIRTTLDSESRKLQKAWVGEIKKLQKLIESRQATQETLEKAKKELKELWKEYTDYALDQGKRRFKLATGRGVEEWEKGDQRLNPRFELHEILKNIQIGLVNMQPSVYMKRFPEVTVEGDRDRDPNPIYLDTRDQDQFHKVMEALESALAVAGEVEELERQWAQSVQREEQLELLYQLEARHPRKQRQTQRTALEQHILKDFHRQFKSLVDETGRKLARASSEETEQMVQELNAAYEELRKDLDGSVLARHVGRPSEDVRFKELRDKIGWWKDVVKYAADERGWLADELRRLEEESKQPGADLEKIQTEYDDLVAWVTELAEDERYTRWVLSGGLEERLRKLGERLKALRNLEGTHQEILEAFNHAENRWWKRVIKIGAPLYQSGNDELLEKDARWREGQVIFLLAQAHEKYQQAKKDLENGLIDLSDTKLKKASGFLEDCKGALASFGKGKEKKEKIDKSIKSLENNINALEKAQEQYKQENKDELEKQKAYEEKLARSNSLSSFVKETLADIKRSAGDEESQESSQKKPLQERLREWVRNKVTKTIKDKIQKLSDEQVRVDDLRDIRDAMRALDLRWGEDGAFEEFRKKLVNAYRKEQLEDSKGREGFGLVLEREDYWIWYDFLREYEEEFPGEKRLVAVFAIAAEAESANDPSKLEALLKKGSR